MKRSISLCSAFLFAGMLSSVLAADETNTTTKIPARAGSGEQVGVGRIDGVTVSGTDTFITRNGATEKLSKELTLPSGATVRPDGTVKLTDGSEVTLRATQVLTFDGKVATLPNSTVTSGATVAQGAAATGGAAGAASSGASSSNQATSTINPDAGRSARSMPADRPVANGTISDGSGGVTQPLAIGIPGQTNPDGSITRADGSVQFPNGSIRPANGQTTTPNAAAAPGTSQGNGLAPSGGNGAAPGAQPARRTAVDSTGTTTAVSPNGVGSAANTNSGAPNSGASSGGGAAGGGTGTTTNSPNNAGTVNPPGQNGSATNSPNNAGTVNQGGTDTGTVNNGNSNPGTANSASGARTNNGVSSGSGGRNSSGASSGGGSGGGSNGAGGGASSGGAAGGAGGASGGSGGGASR